MIAILGASGYVGQAFAKLLIEEDVSFYEFSRKTLDYSDPEKLVNAMEKLNVSVVINCAGYTGKPNVDACEENKEECYFANVILAKNVAMACTLTGAKLVHISSGCIYTGYEKDFNEEDSPNFRLNSIPAGSYYSETKAVGENAVQELCETSYICRLRIPFDENDSPRNYLTKLQKYKKLLNAKNSISHRYDFVKACIHLVKNECPFGIYNIVNTNPVTTKEVAEKLKKYNLIDSCEFFENEEDMYKTAAKAPRSNCVLDNSKIIQTGFKMRSSEEAIEDSLKNWKKIEA
jgi:UDP-glucose 4,6-dehydratase